MGYSEPTRLRLATLSGNECAFPGCTAPIFDTEHNVMLGEVCHIKGRRLGSARYDPDQTDEERAAFDNLMLMCSPHHDIIDKPATRDLFPVEMLRGYKRDHETRFKNTVVKEDVVARIIASIQDLVPQRPAIVLTPFIESMMAGPNNEMRFDYYDFRVSLRNDGDATVKDFRLEVKIPRSYASTSSSDADVPDRSTDEYKFYRRTETAFPGFNLFPDDTKHVLSLTYTVAFDQYKDMDASITVILYSGDQQVSKTDHPIKPFLNPDRLRQLGLIT